MAKVVYKSYNQNDSLLFPHCIGDLIPENDPVRVLDAIVEHLDISAIEATYKGSRVKICVSNSNECRLWQIRQPEAI